jgi:hypothetical protein
VVATWDANNKSAGVTLSGSNLVATATSGTPSVAATRACSGKTYFEVLLGASLTGVFSVGVCNRIYSMTAATQLGANANGCGWRKDGTVIINGSTISTIATYAAADTLCVAMDPMAQLIWFRVGAGNWNNSALNNPATGVGGISTATMTLGPLLPALSGATTAPTMSGTAAFASGSFAQTAPSGFVTLDTIQVAAFNGMVAATGAAFSTYKATKSSTVASPSKKTSVLVAAHAWYGGTTGNVAQYTPAAAPTYVSGIVIEAGVPVAKIVRLYDHNTGLFLGQVTANASTGAYTIPALGRAKVFAVAFDAPTYQALVFDNVVPV